MSEHERDPEPYGINPDKFCTVWRVVTVPRWRHELDVRLVVSTRGEAVVKAIEKAAAANGVKLERVTWPRSGRTQ